MTDIAINEGENTYRFAVWLWRIISPALMIFGTFGNVVTILILTKSKSRISSTCVYLSALATSDILALNTGLLRQWITYSFHIDIRMDLTEGGCKFHWFLVYTVTQFSSWMLVCVTVERFLSTWLPHKRSVACNTRIASLTVAVIASCLVLLNSHYLFGYGNKTETVGNTTTTTKCTPLTDNYSHFVSYQWTWIDLCVFYLVPMFVLVFGNSAIIYKVIESKRKSRRIGPVSASNTMSTLSTSEQPRTQTSKKTSNLTITLVVVCGVFILCITPIVVYPVGEPHWKEGASPEKLAELFLWETLANVLMYVNHAINFVLYFLSGSKFRNDVKRILCGRCLNRTDPGIMNSRSVSIFHRSNADQSGV